MPCAFRIDVAHFLWENIAMPTAGYRDATGALAKVTTKPPRRGENLPTQEVFGKKTYY